MTHHLHREMAMVRADEARRHAAARRRVPARPNGIARLLRRAYVARTPSALALPADLDVRIRYARADDEAALTRLAGLDDAAVPAAPVLVAEVDGEPWAARSLSNSAVIADPFKPTRQLVELLAIRADQLRAAGDALAGDDRAQRPLSPSDAHAR
jgi:hypothetical protein